MKHQKGFTLIELMSTLVLVIALLGLAVVAKTNLDAANRDKQRKTAVNALYYGLTKAYFVKNKSYPTSLSKKNLPYINPSFFTDPEGNTISDLPSDYHYKGQHCTQDKCQNFTLTARLEKEGTYKKSSNN